MWPVDDALLVEDVRAALITHVRYAHVLHRNQLAAQPTYVCRLCDASQRVTGTVRGQGCCTLSF